MYWSEETEETRNEGEGLWWRDVVTGFEVLGEEERFRVSQEGGDKVVFAARYESVCINVPQYLRLLMERADVLGGKMIRTTIRTVAGVDGVGMR
jgi:D-amino-acid oxidase